MFTNVYLETVITFGTIFKYLEFNVSDRHGIATHYLTVKSTIVDSIPTREKKTHLPKNTQCLKYW